MGLTSRSGWGVCPDITMFRGSGDGVNLYMQVWVGCLFGHNNG